MNFRPFSCGCTGEKKVTFESLRSNLSAVQQNIEIIPSWKLTEETEKALVAELEAKKAEIKVKMHEFIENL
jgi:hypothetical protein